MGNDPGGHLEVVSSERVVLEATRQELQQRLKTSQSRTRRHALWALLGVSPGAAIPMLGMANEFGGIALVGISLAVVGIEGWRAMKGSMESAEIQEELRRIGED